MSIPTKKKGLLLVTLSAFALSVVMIVAKTRNVGESIGEKLMTASACGDSDLRIEIITSNDSTFGYDIFRDEKLLIHQPHVPAVPGSKGFNAREHAMKVAELVVEKIRNNTFPPSVSVDELDSLGVPKNWTTVKR